MDASLSNIKTNQNKKLSFKPTIFLGYRYLHPHPHSRAPWECRLLAVSASPPLLTAQSTEVSFHHGQSMVRMSGRLWAILHPLVCPPNTEPSQPQSSPSRIQAGQDVAQDTHFHIVPSKGAEGQEVWRWPPLFLPQVTREKSADAGKSHSLLRARNPWGLQGRAWSLARGQHVRFPIRDAGPGSSLSISPIASFQVTLELVFDGRTAGL